LGETTSTSEQLAAAVHVPGMVGYDWLKLLPLWYSLGGDPWFEQIVNSLGPRQSIPLLTAP